MTLARKILGCGAGMAALAAFAIPALAGTVVASTGPSAAQFRVGSQVTSTQRITLSAGDTVTVLENGGTRVLRGPGSFVLARRSATAENSAFAALTAQRNAGRARIASSRGDGAAPTNPNLWYVDIARSGTVCLADPGNVRLWRADTAARAELAVTAAGTEAIRVTFPEKEGLARWSRNTAVREGVAYRIGTSEVTFKFLAAVPEGAEAMAQALIENGCMIQLEQLAAATLEA